MYIDDKQDIVNRCFDVRPASYKAQILGMPYHAIDDPPEPATFSTHFELF